MRALMAAVLGIALSTSGCLQTTMSWTIYPDGSGKLVTKTVLNTPKQDGGAVPHSHGSMQGLIEVSTRVEPGADADHVVVANECYFEDFNKVTYNGQPVGTFKALPEGGYEAKLFKESSGQAMPKAKGGADPVVMLKLVAAQMKGLVYRMELHLPGEVAATNGEKADARTAALTITEQTFLDDQKREAIAKMEALKATCAAADPAVVKEAAAFRADLAKAKEAHASDFGARSMDQILQDDEKLRKQGEKDAGESGDDTHK